MPSSDGLPSSPPGPDSSLEQSLKYYKAQYELLEAELAEFQASSKDLEAELERDIEASEKRERQLKDKAANLQYEVDEWKSKYKQAKGEASNVQNTLQKEITELRDTNRTLQLRLRDTEVANDDYERQQRNTESSLEDMESKYNQTIERSVMLEEEMRTGEQERENLRIEVQRIRDEFSDFKIEAEIVREKLRKSEKSLAQRHNTLSLEPVQLSTTSPRSELSPTTTNASSPSFDTPPAKTASSPGLSDTPTPPSPPESERSSSISKPFITPSIPKTRLSVSNANNTTPRPPHSSRPNGHTRGPSIPAISRTGPSSAYRQSFSRPAIPQRPAGLPQSQSIVHHRNLRGKMQKLEERVQTARSKLPAPVNTPPRASPRSASALGHNMPSSVTMRSRKRNGGSTISGVGSQADSDQGLQHSTPTASRTKQGRQSLSLQNPPHLPATPLRGEMAAPPPRPASRTSVSSRQSHNVNNAHNRPGSRASLSGFRAPLGSGIGGSYTPNASTDRVRPKSSLSNHAGYDGTMDDGDVSFISNDASQLIEEADEFGAGGGNAITPTPRRKTFAKQRISDVGSAIPAPTSKRTSFGGGSSVSIPSHSPSKSLGLGSSRRQSSSFIRPERPPSRLLDGVMETEAADHRTGYDVSDTF